MEKAEHKIGFSHNEEEVEQNANEVDTSAKTKEAFHVDTGLIPQAALDEHGSNELHNLGLSIFNQDVFEQGIMEQVDQALAKEEENRLKSILQRELTAIGDDIRMAKVDLERANVAESSIESSSNQSREIQRQLESIRKQKENKLRQIKTLKVRRENVRKKLAGIDSTAQNVDESGDSTFEAFQVGNKQKKETERERMIRTGEMTPFGTVVKTAAQKPLTSSVKLSDFEKQLMTKDSIQQKAQKDFSKYLKRKAAKTSKITEASKIIETRTNKDDQIYSSTSSNKPSARKTNRFDEKDWKIYNKEAVNLQPRSKRKTAFRIHHEFSEDKQLSDEEDFLRDEDQLGDEVDDEDEYQPSKEELLEEFSDKEEDYEDTAEEDGHCNEARTKKSKHGKKKKPRPLPKYRGNSDEDEPVRTRVKRDLSIKRERDDADPEEYQRRLLKQQKLDRQEEQEADASDEDDDEADFDGGLKVPRKLWRKLFKYQKTGVRWLWELHCQQAGGIVGDEMGLGKTIQTISFLAALRSSKVKNVNFPYRGLGPTIIVCPTTVMHQWLKEFHKWWPDFRVAILHSSGSFAGSESDMVRSIAKSQGILITSFNTLVIHQELVLRFNWHYVILDEGHKIRNPDAKVTLCCKQFRTPHRIILSGSPIQNNLKELWSLFDFVFPGKLGTLPDFMQHFSVPIVQGGYANATRVQVETAYRCACILRDTINPYLIRRMKADVKKSLDLPNKNEQVLFCRLTDEQREVYQEYLESRECNAIIQGKFQVFAGLITLRKICNHPDLSTGGLQVFRGDDATDEAEYQFGYYKRSGKMIVVEALLRLWHKQKHRVLLFTQSKAMLNILEKFVQDNGYTYLTMDGGTAISARQPLISQYNNNPSIYIFLLTTRVGGLGVNLTGADRVIIYDPDWNPSTDVQARERAWRIGQTRQVTIYRLLTSGTIEEKIYHRQIFKQFLTNRVLKDPKQRRLFKSQDMMELFTLGSKDNEEGTETSALFAGTGSDVKIPKKLKRNRFDEIQERKQKERVDNEELEKTEDKRGGKEIQDLVEEGETSMDFDIEELERMKEFARQLSRKIELEKNQRDPLMKSNEETLSEDTTEPHAVMKQDEITLSKDASDRLDHTNLSSQKIEHSSNSNILNTAQSCQRMEEADANKLKAKSHKWTQNGKVWTIPIKRKQSLNINKNQKYSEEEDNGRSSKDFSKPKSSKHGSKSQKSEKQQSEDDRKKQEMKRQKRKRKHHDAKFEGERIPHLVKQRPLHKSSQPEEQQPQEQSHGAMNGDGHQDDYVLRELFKKTGIHGAMKHDKIMESGRPDYVLVEAEAERVAREAATALKRSRQQCSSALSGMPTWTGQHGGLVKPRFGQKKNSLLFDRSGRSGIAGSSQDALSSQAAQKEEKHFDGSVSGSVVLSGKSDSMTSSDLLNRIRARKRMSSLPAVEEEDDEFLRPDQPQTIEPKDEDLIQDIRNYVAFMATKDGEATTQEIVLNFGKRLPKSDAPKFKAMLNQICDFHAGVWRLKSEFR